MKVDSRKKSRGMKNTVFQSFIKHIKSTKTLFLCSFRGLGSDYLYTILADMLQLVLVLIVLVPGFLFLIQSSFVPLMNDMMPTLMYVNSYSSSQGTLPPMTSELQHSLDDNVRTIKAFFVKSGLTIAGFVLALLIVSSVIRAFVYSRLHKIRFRRFIRLFFINNIIWYAFWGLLMLVIIRVFEVVTAGYVIAIMLMFMLMLMPIYRSLHVEDDSVKSVLRRFFSKGLASFYHFIAPLVLIYLVFIISFYMLAFITSAVSYKLAAFIIFIYAFALMGWSRHYMFISVRSHLKKEGK